MTSADERLQALVPYLDTQLGYELARLVRADSEAGQVLELQARAQRAEDLVAELRRQLAARNRQLDELRAIRSADPDPGSLGDRLRRAAQQRGPARFS